jgi:hypothetical protein
MSARNGVAVVLICVPVFPTSCACNEQPIRQQREPNATVTLCVSQVTVERLENDLLFVCQAVIDNATGAELTVKSNYSSAFDGLSLVVIDEKGRRLAVQPYLHHQSVVSLEPRSFLLAKGKNCRELTFPVPGLPKDRREYRVLVLGTLPGSEYNRTLCSDLVTAVEKGSD